MKKKIAIFLFTVLIASTLVACNSKPDDMDEDTYELGKKAVNVMDEYFDGEISSEEADEQLSTISDRLDDLDSDNSIYNLTNSEVVLDISMFSLSMSMSDNEGMQDCYNDLSDMLEI